MGIHDFESREAASCDERFCTEWYMPEEARAEAGAAPGRGASGSLMDQDEERSMDTTAGRGDNRGAKKGQAPERGAGASWGAAGPAAHETPGTSIRDRIRARAYEIYRHRRGGPGDALSDWLRAEREIRSEADRRAGGQFESETSRGELEMFQPED